MVDRKFYEGKTIVELEELSKICLDRVQTIGQVISKKKEEENNTG